MSCVHAFYHQSSTPLFTKYTFRQYCICSDNVEIRIMWWLSVNRHYFLTFGHLRTGLNSDKKLNQVQYAFSTEPHWFNANYDWTEVGVKFELGASLIVIGAMGPKSAGMGVGRVLISLTLAVAHRWINHWSLWCMASATPDLRLPSRPQGITALWPVPNVLLGDRVTRVLTCLELLPGGALTGSQTRASRSRVWHANHYITKPLMELEVIEKWLFKSNQNQNKICIAP